VPRGREEQVRQAVPKALPLPASTFRKTFEVQPAPYDPVVPHSPQLTSSVRAEERRAFDVSGHTHPHAPPRWC
jgi:hypothetical protein